MISPCYFFEMDTGSSVTKNRFFARNGSLLKKHATLKKIPVGETESLVDFLKKRSRTKKVRHVVLYGKGLDTSIEKSVADLVKAGFDVWIPVDAVEFRNEKERENILIELRKLGAQMGNTDFILQNT